MFSAESLANAHLRSPSPRTPLDQELNIRGITNTRLDSPSADPSVGTFVDGVYIGRTGDYNFDFFDLERVEVIRGPQGVLLGKNVVGGALSVITAAPSQADLERGHGLVRQLQRHTARRPRERRLDRHALRAPVAPVPHATTATPRTSCIIAISRTWTRSSCAHSCSGSPVTAGASAASSITPMTIPTA